jgi:general secretion pathway protein N
MRWFGRSPSGMGTTGSMGIRAPKGPAAARATRTLRSPAGRASAPSLEPRRNQRRWVWAGIAIGTLVSLVLYAPASWLAAAVRNATAGQVLLADAQGTVWQGDAVAVFTGGAGSRDARALPGRLAWSLRPALIGGLGAHIGLTEDCCLQGTVALRLRTGWNNLRVEVQPGRPIGTATPIGQWPAALLTGLGTPWNTLQPGGALRLSTQDLVLQWTAGRFTLHGQAALELLDFSSRLSTLPRLGSYRTELLADPAQAGTARVYLSTQGGALQLRGEGTWSASGLRFRGEASATTQDEAALNNLLNIIGRRQGARSLISIG